MRPLFAIAPLALLLALFGPTTSDGSRLAVLGFKARILPTAEAEEVARQPEQRVIDNAILSKPAVYSGTKPLTTGLQTTSFEASVRHR